MDTQKLVEAINKSKIIISFLIIIGASLFLFYPSLHYYFFQDDWFVLNWVRNNNIASFFKFRTDIIYWRPLAMPLFFWVGRKIFGLNPFGYHFIVFAFHFLNIALIGYISLKLIKKIKAAIISSFLYSTAAFHFMSLSWLSLAWNVFGQFFFLLSFVFYIKF